jgi:hypothetical protein
MNRRRVRNNPTQAKRTKRRLEWATQAFVADKESTVISLPGQHLGYYVGRGVAHDRVATFFTERRTRGLVQRCEAGKPGSREMAKKCVLSVLSWLLPGFYVFIGIFLRRLCVFAIGGGPEGGGAAAAGHVTRSD